MQWNKYLRKAAVGLNNQFAHWKISVYILGFYETVRSGYMKLAFSGAFKKRQKLLREEERRRAGVKKKKKEK
jgi:hypothetical protein